MTDLYLKRTAHGLAAFDDSSKDTLRKIKLGEMVRVKLNRLRNPQFHRKFWAMMNFVYASCGHWQTTEDLVLDLKFRIGHVDKKQVIDYNTGEVLAEILTPKSIAFHAMDESQFQEFVERCIQEICATMVPGLEDDVLRQEVLHAIA